MDSLLSNPAEANKSKKLLCDTIREYVVIATLIGSLVGASTARSQVDVEHIVAEKVQPILPKEGGGGVAVAVRINGKTEFFNYGFANLGRKERVTPDSIFNLGSVGKLFATTLLAEAVKRNELNLDDPVAKYVTELQRGGDIRRVTLGQLASHTSGLPRVPQQYEKWHRGKYTWPDFVRFTYIGFAPQQKLGVVILCNRGKQHATGSGRQILHALAQDQSEPSNEGEPKPDSE